MERVTQILNSTKERLANPFVFSFFLCWIFYNWEITVGLIWYDSAALKSIGYNSIFELIRDHMRCVQSHLIPFGVSVIVTLALPFLRIVFIAFNAKITKIGDGWFFKISADSNIPTTKYLKLREEYLSLLGHLENVIKDESTYQAKYQEIQNELFRLRDESKILSSIDDEKYLNGRWEIRYTHPQGPKMKKGILVNNSFVELYQETEDGKRETFTNCSISFFKRDIRSTERLSFQLRLNDGKTLVTFSLSKTGNEQFDGLEDFRHPISFSRVS